MDVRLKVLLVEDDAVDRAFVRKALADAVDLVEAETLAEAYGALLGTQFDCVLCDLGLPDGDGVQLIRRLRAESDTPPAVVVLTARTDDGSAVTTMQSGAQHFLVKGQFNRRLLLRTMRYAMERQRLLEMQRRVSEQDRLSSIGHLAAAMAHEVNNPAAVLLANQELLAELLVDVERAVESSDPDHALQTLREAHQIVRDDLNAVRRIVSTVTDLRAYAQPRAELDDRVDLNAVVQTACNLARPELRQRARLLVELGDVPSFKGDPGRLQQALIHLLVNAAQAVADAGGDEHVVSAHTWSDGRFAWLSVSDSGVGIPTSTQRRIFDPFFTTRAPDRSSGMGLAIVAEAIRRHEGNISVVSSPGSGARFEIRIPLDRSDTWVAVPTCRLGTPIPALRRLRLLLVDDEHTICRALSRLLRDEYEVVAVPGGRHAIDLLRRDQAFDAVLCDVMMPGVDGPGLHVWMMENAPHLAERTIFCTAGAFTAEAQSFLSTVPNACLNKPIELDDLRRLLLLSDVMGEA